MTKAFSAFPICVVATAALLLGPVQVNIAFGQEAQLEEIVVTARKREETIQDVPLAITAFTSEEIARRNIQEMRDIALFTPGFNFEDFGGAGGTMPVIRGTTQVASFRNTEQNVSFFFDGVYLPRSYVTDLGFANIERIEVVKGPQSARYGRNAFMGAVNYIPRKPTDDWEVKVKGVAGNFKRYDAAATVSGPIVPGVLSILVGMDYSEFDGSWENTHPYADIDFDQGTDARQGGYERGVLSGAVLFTPNEDMRIDLSYYDYNFDREHRAQNWFAELNAESQFLNCGQWNPDVRPAGTPGFGGGGQWWRLYCGELIVRNIPTDPRGYARQLNATFLRASINWRITDSIEVEYVFGQMEADSKTLGYKDSLPGCTFITPAPFPPLNGCIFESGPIGDFEVDSHEVRVSWDDGGSLRVAGGLYYTENEDFYTANFSALPPLSGVPTAPVNILDQSQFQFYAVLTRTLRTDKTVSPFIELSYSLMDGRSRIGIEARYSNSDKFEGALASGGAGGLAEFTGLTFENEFKSFTPRITWEYDLSTDRLLFISAATGVRAGGFNPSAYLEENRTFDEDQNWTYEIGMKNTFMGGQLRLNGSLFWVEWSNVQITAQDPGNPAILPLNITRNLGNVRSTGFELEGAYAFTANLTLSGSAYYGDAKYKDGTRDLRWARTPLVCDDIVCPINGDIAGNQMERQSKWQATLSAEWRDELAFGFAQEYYLRWDMAYQSKQYAEAVNLSWVPERTIVNASIGIVGDRFEAQLWARNLFDEQYVSGALVGQPNVQYNAYLGERQTYGLTITARLEDVANW